MREENDTVAIEKEFNEYLWNTISIRDTSVRKLMKENFYVSAQTRSRERATAISA